MMEIGRRDLGVCTEVVNGDRCKSEAIGRRRIAMEAIIKQLQRSRRLAAFWFGTRRPSRRDQIDRQTSGDQVCACDGKSQQQRDLVQPGTRTRRAALQPAAAAVVGGRTAELHAKDRSDRWRSRASRWANGVQEAHIADNRVPRGCGLRIRTCELSRK